MLVFALNKVETYQLYNLMGRLLCLQQECLLNKIGVIKTQYVIVILHYHKMALTQSS